MSVYHFNVPEAGLTARERRISKHIVTTHDLCNTREMLSGSPVARTMDTAHSFQRSRRLYAAALFFCGIGFSLARIGFRSNWQPVVANASAMFAREEP
jgi:hypothetical protein